MAGTVTNDLTPIAAPSEPTALSISTCFVRRPDKGVQHMQFLVTVTVGKHEGAPPAELQASMTKLVHDETRAGTFVITGGLAERADGARVGVSKAGLVRGEPHLPIHGYAVVECPALEQATQVASRLLRVHQDFAPDWEVECDVRQIVTDCLP
jgi:hypothetical protein